MPLVPVIVVNFIRTAITRLSGPALARFGAMVSGRIGVTVSGSAANMAAQLSNYIVNNPMSAGLVVASLAASTVDFSVDDVIDLWKKNSDNGDIPGDVKYILEQVGKVNENRQEVTGDQDDDTVLGLDVADLRKAAQVLAFGDRQCRILIDQFGDIDTVIAVRNALFSLDDQQLMLYKERHGA